MEMSKRKVAVIGGGAAGIVAAIEAADNGAEVTIFERNDRIGSGSDIHQLGTLPGRRK